ncbi:hypothetical protein KSE_70810 [Kitasatospora setae KM-6054]|uniref:CBM-cenC domain-containing protein n=1 Tax=Kitasatospora setae (strain ATCC 33774 / DSM 43861 / JCM 3304 / KCC A-0304 / NBRC 14216 / KM-6054) TaxID=452652 RepID=E4NIP0_KITSK|nr:hypothetical protein KSE_70810 [Kitasatospora setae KM-6054]
MSRRRVSDGLPVAAVFGAVALAATATLGLGGPASSAEPPQIDVIGNGTFTAPPAHSGTPTDWLCQESASVRDDPDWGRLLEGAPSAGELAWCTQRVTVLPNSTYTLRAGVRGPYVFLGTEGGGPGETVQNWSNNPDWNALTVTVTTGPDSTSLLVRLHGWYGQAPYQVKWVDMFGPGVLPSWCVPPSWTSPAPPSSPPPSRTSTAEPGSTANDTPAPDRTTVSPSFRPTGPCPSQR